MIVPDAVIAPPGVSIWELTTYWPSELGVVVCVSSVRAGGLGMARGMAEVVRI